MASGRPIQLALILGFVIALILFGASELAIASDYGRWARVLEWQAALFQNLIPAPNLGTAERPLYEGTPLHLVAWYVGVMLSFPMYTAGAYIALAVRQRALSGQGDR
jgi:hypothetical protein